MDNTKKSVDHTGNHEDANISVTRSDGVHLDLLSVFATKGSGHSPLQDIVDDVNSDKKAESPDTSHISITRSDGFHHDIVKVFKTASVEEKPDLVKTKSRSNSLGLAELTGFITQSFSRAVMSPPKESSQEVFHPKSIRIVHMSDTINMLIRSDKNSFLPNGDILVHTGDFTSAGTDDEYELFNQWLASVSGRYLYRIVCLGNRDVKVYGSNWDLMKRKLSNATHVLCHEEATVLGIRFYGCPWHWQQKSNLDPRPGAPSHINARFDQIPAGTQVLLTHGPAYGRLDGNTAGDSQEHWGSKDLLEAVRRVKPGVHLHGHVKDARGVLLPFGNTPLTVNACLVDKGLSVMYACPTVVKAVQILDCSPGSGASSGSGATASNWIFALDSLE